MRIASAAVLLSIWVVLLASTQAADVLLDEAFLNITIIAAELSVIAQGRSDPKGFDLVQTFSDGTERAITAKKDDLCYVAFGSPFPGPVEQVWQRVGSLIRLDLDHYEEACSNAEKCCDVRSTVGSRYRRASFRSAMETALRDCVATCPGSNCSVVLTGHGHGGAVANAAGVYLADLNPVGITFGAPPVFEAGGCDAIDSSNWYRFVNSVESQYRRSYGIPPGGLIYDFKPLSYDGIPMKNPLFSDHIGHYLILSLNQNVAYIGLDSQQKFEPTFVEAGKMAADNPDRFNGGYLDRLRFIRDKFSMGYNNPVPLGFAEYDLCTTDSLCASRKCRKSCLLCPPRCLG